MAKQGFSRVKGNKRGYKQVMNGGSVQRILASEASRAEGGASAFTNAHGHSGMHFADKQIQGIFAKGLLVYPTTHEGLAHGHDFFTSEYPKGR